MRRFRPEKTNIKPQSKGRELLTTLLDLTIIVSGGNLSQEGQKTIENDEQKNRVNNLQKDQR